MASFNQLQLLSVPPEETGCPGVVRGSAGDLLTLEGRVGFPQQITPESERTQRQLPTETAQVLEEQLVDSISLCQVDARWAAIAWPALPSSVSCRK